MQPNPYDSPAHEPARHVARGVFPSRRRVVLGGMLAGALIGSSSGAGAAITLWMLHLTMGLGADLAELELVGVEFGVGGAVASCILGMLVGMPTGVVAGGLFAVAAVRCSRRAPYRFISVCTAGTALAGCLFCVALLFWRGGTPAWLWFALYAACGLLFGAWGGWRLSRRLVRWTRPAL